MYGHNSIKLQFMWYYYIMHIYTLEGTNGEELPTISQMLMKKKLIQAKKSILKRYKKTIAVKHSKKQISVKHRKHNTTIKHISMRIFVICFFFVLFLITRKIILD